MKKSFYILFSVIIIVCLAGFSWADVCAWTISSEVIAQPNNPPPPPPKKNPPPDDEKKPPKKGDQDGYNIEQAISDRAQETTIAFDAVAFLTGDVGSGSFFPPGKVADFWGFQYLRDNDSTEMGHSGDFLTSAAVNTYNNLTEGQQNDLVKLAKNQVELINEYGYKRFTLIKAFNRLLEGNLPKGTKKLNITAVCDYSAELYKLDGQISFERAKVMGKIISELSEKQVDFFDKMATKGMADCQNLSVSLRILKD